MLNSRISVKKKRDHMRTSALELRTVNRSCPVFCVAQELLERIILAVTDVQHESGLSRVSSQSLRNIGLEALHHVKSWNERKIHIHLAYLGLCQRTIDTSHQAIQSLVHEFCLDKLVYKMDKSWKKK